MPSPSPSPIPVILVNDPSWLDITTQIAIPVLSLLVAAAAILHAHTSQRRREAKENVEKSRTARDAFAPQLREFGRRFRSGRPTSGAPFIDEWNEITAGAPDDASQRMILWIMGRYGQLGVAFGRRKDKEVMREQAMLFLQADFEARVSAWQKSGEADLSPHQEQADWPAPPPVGGVDAADEGMDETQ